MVFVHSDWMFSEKSSTKAQIGCNRNVTWLDRKHKPTLRTYNAIGVHIKKMCTGYPTLRRFNIMCAVCAVSMNVIARVLQTTWPQNTIVYSILLRICYSVWRKSIATWMGERTMHGTMLLWYRFMTSDISLLQWTKSKPIKTQIFRFLYRCAFQAAIISQKLFPK